MDALTGKSKKISIREDVLCRIKREIKTGHYESGGIIGLDRTGVISEFQLDEIQNPELYEYYPNTTFLNEVINGMWLNNHISFAGFVHSHLHNNEISPQDTAYCREILKANDFMDGVFVGIIDLSRENDCTKWYAVSSDSVLLCEADIIKNP